MKLKEYLKKLWKTFLSKPISILFTALVLLGVAPIIFYFIIGVFDVIINRNLNINAIIQILMGVFPWWVDLILNPLKFVIGYILSFIVTLILVYHRILIHSKPNYT